MAHIVAAIAVGLDADPVVGALKVNALGADILRAAGDLAADGEAMPMQKRAIGNGDVAAWCVRPGELMAPDLMATSSSPTSANT